MNTNVSYIVNNVVSLMLTVTNDGNSINVNFICGTVERRKSTMHQFYCTILFMVSEIHLGGDNFTNTTKAITATKLH